jgi:hypothetical protein
MCGLHLRDQETVVATIEGLALPNPLWRGGPLPTVASLPASPSRTCVLRPMGHTPLEPPTDLFLRTDRPSFEGTWMDGRGPGHEEGRVKRRSGHGSSTKGRRRAEPRGEQVFLAGENAACLRMTWCEPCEFRRRREGRRGNGVKNLRGS